MGIPKILFLLLAISYTAWTGLLVFALYGNHVRISMLENAWPTALQDYTKKKIRPVQIILLVTIPVFFIETLISWFVVLY